jgi:hypothetical protein
MGMRLSFAAVSFAVLVSGACPYTDFLSSNHGLAIGGGGGSGSGPDALRFIGQPSTATAGDIITPAIQVQVLDSLGIPDSAFTGSISVTLSVNPVGGNLSGSRSIVPSNGIALFGDLVIDRSGAGYVLRASAPGATSASSSSFTILAP